MNPVKQPHIRQQILETAIGYITKDRQATHGKPEDSFQTIADFWTAHLKGRGKLDEGEILDRIDVAAMMIGMKAARIAGNPDHVDNWIDTAGYAGCGGEIATLQKAISGGNYDHETPVATYWKPGPAELDEINNCVKKLSRLRNDFFNEREQALILNGMTRPDTFTQAEVNELIDTHNRFFQS